MTHRPIEDLLREADRTRVAQPSPQLWSRIHAGLDAELDARRAAEGDSAFAKTAGQPPASQQLPPSRAVPTRVAAPLRVVHRASLQRARRLLSVAAALLVVVVAGWWLIGSGEVKTGPTPEGSYAGGVSAVDRSSLEGPLSIDGAPALYVPRDAYTGVQVKLGDASTQEIRACSPC